MKILNKQSMQAQYSFDKKTSLPGFGLYILGKKAMFLNAQAVEMLCLDPKFANTWTNPRTILRHFNKQTIHKAFAYLRSIKDSKRDPNATYELTKLEDKVNPDHIVRGSDVIDPFFIGSQRLFPLVSLTRELDHYDEERHSHRHNHLSASSFLPSLTGRHSCDSASFAIALNKGEMAGTKLYIKLNALFAQGKISHINIAITRVASYLFELTPHEVADSASFDLYLPTGQCIFGHNYYKLLGYKPDDPDVPFIQKKWLETVVHTDDISTLQKELDIIQSQKLGDQYEFLYRSRCKDGSYIWTKSVGRVVSRDANGRAIRIIGVNIDINRVIEGYEQLQSKVFTDILTGIKNRTYLITHIADFIYKADKPLTILFADVTALKAYNDYLGHSAGDRLLCSATILLEKTINRPNELIRISGDEVVSIMHDCDEQEAQKLSKNIEHVVAKYNESAPIRMPVFFSAATVTIDLSAYAGRKLNEEEKDEAMSMFYQAIQNADNLMQINKKRNYQAHYTMVRAYIENQLNKKIVIQDKRLFA